MTCKSVHKQKYSFVSRLPWTKHSTVAQTLHTLSDALSAAAFRIKLIKGANRKHPSHNFEEPQCLIKLGTNIFLTYCNCDKGVICVFLKFKAIKNLP